MDQLLDAPQLAVWHIFLMPHLADEDALQTVAHKVVAAALWTYLIVLLPTVCCVHALGDQQRPAAQRWA